MPLLNPKKISVKTEMIENLVLMLINRHFVLSTSVFGTAKIIRAFQNKNEVNDWG